MSAWSANQLQAIRARVPRRAGVGGGAAPDHDGRVHLDVDTPIIVDRSDKLTFPFKRSAGAGQGNLSRVSEPSTPAVLHESSNLQLNDTASTLIDYEWLCPRAQALEVSGWPDGVIGTQESGIA
jgi:hypothetical protein